MTQRHKNDIICSSLAALLGRCIVMEALPTSVWSQDAREDALPLGWLSVLVHTKVWEHLYAVLLTLLQVGQVINLLFSREKYRLQVKKWEITRLNWQSQYWIWILVSRNLSKQWDNTCRILTKTGFLSGSYRRLRGFDTLFMSYWRETVAEWQQDFPWG